MGRNEEMEKYEVVPSICCKTCLLFVPEDYESFGTCKLNEEACPGFSDICEGYQGRQLPSDQAEIRERIIARISDARQGV